MAVVFLLLFCFIFFFSFVFWAVVGFILFYFGVLRGFWPYFQTPWRFLRRLRSFSSQKTQMGPVTGQNKISKKLENLSKTRWAKGTPPTDIIIICVEFVLGIPGALPNNP